MIFTYLSFTLVQVIQKTEIKEMTSRGGGRPQNPDATRKTLSIPTKNGVPLYTFTKGALEKMQTVKDRIAQLPAQDVDCGHDKVRHPFLEVFGWKMDAKVFENEIRVDCGHKSVQSLRKFFSEMGMRYETSGDVMVFSFDVEGYRKNGNKVHVGGSGHFKPEMVFYEL